MSDSEEQVFLTLRQSSFENSSVPTTATDFCVMVTCYRSLNFKAVLGHYLWPQNLPIIFSEEIVQIFEK